MWLANGREEIYGRKFGRTIRGIPNHKLESILESLPLRGTGKPEEVAAAVCFLASDASSFMTGEIMDVDGGLMMD